LTCVHTGWVFTRTMRNNAHAHVLAALQAGVQEIPFTVTGLDFDNGTEFLNKAVITWAGERDIYFTRSRPYKKNDQATIESKNNHLVRKYGFYYRYDTSEERHALKPSLEARQRPVQLPHPDQETGRLGPGQGRPPQASLRQATDPAGPPPGRRSARPGPGTRTDRLPRPTQPRRDRPRDRRHPGDAAHTRQGQDRAALPRHRPDRPARCS